MSAATVDDVDLERLADELLEQADDLEPDEVDLEDPYVEPPTELRAPPRRPHRRTVPDVPGQPSHRDALLELVGHALEAKIANELDDNDRAVDALERTARRAVELADRLRARPARLSDPVPTVP